MDFSRLDTKPQADQGFEVQLRHFSTDEPLAAWVTVLGQDSDAYNAYIEERDRRWWKLMDNKRKPVRPDTREETRELVVAMTTGWRDIELDGKPLPFNPENVRRFYLRFPWVVDQLGMAIHDRANFLPAASTSSSTSPSTSSV